jgi:hypothetical protein
MAEQMTLTKDLRIAVFAAVLLVVHALYRPSFNNICI